MLSLSSLIDFLLSLLRDPEVADEFARDPQGVLARHGLDNITADDVRDVAPLLADCDGVTARPAPVHHSRGDGRDDHDPVNVIHHVTRSHHVEVRDHHHHHQHQTVEYKQYHSEFHYTDNSVHVEEGGTYIRDSFNQDNDVVDNKGGVIDDSNVVVGDENTVGNSEETTDIEGSFNEDASETTTVTDSGNDASLTIIDAGPAEPVTVADTYAVNQPADPVDASADAGVVDPAA